MTSTAKLRHVFVEHLPERLENGVVYVAIDVGTVAHRCCCGCGLEVVTPLSPTDWSLIYDGESVSLDPSIGNWSFPCRSHYWIRNNTVFWAAQWSDERIDAGRERDRIAKRRHYGADDDREPVVQAQRDSVGWGAASPSEAAPVGPRIEVATPQKKRRRRT